MPSVRRASRFLIMRTPSRRPTSASLDRRSAAKLSATRFPAHVEGHEHLRGAGGASAQRTHERSGARTWNRGRSRDGDGRRRRRQLPAAHVGLHRERLGAGGAPRASLGERRVLIVVSWLVATLLYRLWLTEVIDLQTTAGILAGLLALAL